MTKSCRLESEVCVSCDAVFDIPAHATFFGELFILSFPFASLQSKSPHGGKERAAVRVPSQVSTSSAVWRHLRVSVTVRRGM